MKKNLLSVCIAIALQSSALPAFAEEADINDASTCPENIASLSQEEQKKVSLQCKTDDNDDALLWIAGGAAAIATGVAVAFHDDNDSHGSSSSTPTPPDPDDDGGDTPTPPPVPDDDDTPTPPEPDTGVTTFSNGVALDKGQETLSFDDLKLVDGTHLGEATLSYSEQDKQWQLTTREGKTLNVTGWNVTNDNAAVIEGTQPNGHYWKYDSRGYLIFASNNTQVVTGDSTTNTSDRGLDISGEEEIGAIITGDKTVNTLSGDTHVSDGATGIVISGDGTTNTISGNSTVDGATGALISGDNTKTTVSSDATVTGGGTGMIIDGDNTLLDNKGTTTVSGEGSTGSVINGDWTQVINEGPVTVSDGGTGAKVNGDHSIVDNIGDTTASGAGSAALSIDGDYVTVISDGVMTITDGATGAIIDGDNARIANTGNASVDGAGSIGTLINGDNATLTQNGNMLVTGGAYGVQVKGKNSRITNKGKTTVRDAGSIGFLIAGSENIYDNEGDVDVSLLGTGALISGDNSQVTLDGNINVHAEKDSKGVYRGATGINVTGNNTTTEIAGSVSVSGRYGNGEQVSSEDKLTGVTVSGTDNDIVLDGELNMLVDDQTSNSGQHPDVYGLSIQGDGNTAKITGGLDIDYVLTPTRDEVSTTGININGASTVTLSGKSTINIEAAMGTNVALASVINRGTLILDENSEVDVNFTNNTNSDYYDSAILRASGEGSTIENRGSVVINGATPLFRAENGAHITNSGEITGFEKQGGSVPFALMEASDSASLIENSAGGTITLTSTLTPSGGGGINKFPLAWYKETYYAMLAHDGATVVNDEGATIILQGAGVYGVAASTGTAINAGDIYLDGFKTTLDDEGNITDTSYWQPSPLYLTSAGMIVGSSSNGVGNATATNTGTITVNNAGFGMMALNGGTAINEGTINLTADEGREQEGENQLVGMVALNGGTVINDTTGTINIKADYGKPFYSDSSSVVINYGKVCIDGACQDSDVWNPRDNNVSMVSGNGDMITAADETLTDKNVITDPAATETVYVRNAGTVSGGMVAVKNHGDVTNEITGNISKVTIDAGGVYTNEGTTGTVNIIGEFNNSGTTTTVSVDGGVFNNTGTVTGLTGTTVAGSVINNSGSMASVEQWASTMTNIGLVTDWNGASSGAVLNNEAGGEITTLGFDAAATVNNAGKISNASVEKSAVLNNQAGGEINTLHNWAGTLNNSGTITSWYGDSASGVLNNEADGVIDQIHFTAAATINNAGTITQGSVDKKGTFNNLEGGTVTLIDNGLWSGQFNNWGTVNSDADIATGGDGHTLYNGDTGVINGQVTTSKNNGGSKAINDGTINIDKTNNVAMSAHGSAKMVNNGTINVGTKGTTQTNMVGMQLESDAKADAVIENNGTINVYASNSYAFSQLGSNGHIVNNGTVNIDDSATGSGFIKQDGKTIEGSDANGDGIADGNEVHYLDYTPPTEPDMTPPAPAPQTDGGTSSPSDASGSFDLSGYVVGTNADGSAGQLTVNNASLNGVGINTGFTAGTADTTVTFDNVVEGDNLTNADAIQSTSVVWNAQGTTDASGNVDVTMTKNAYTDVVTDDSVSDVAQALDAGYTNNELYTSLNLGTTAELNSALKQISGSQATTVFREARVLSNRFNMLADNAQALSSNGLAFNVVAKGDPRAELGNDTQYDMLALRQTLDLTDAQSLTMEYGIARLDGEGSSKAGDNGVTGGYSQFFGLKHRLAFENGVSWNNALRYDVHDLESSRSVAYGDVNKVADSDARQQYLEFRSEGAKTFTLSEGMTVTPYAGVKFRHTLEDGYRERSAGDFNLTMNAGSETAVDSVAGLKLDYAGKNGWSASMTLEGGPNLSYSKSQRTASLQGAAGQQFSLDDGQKGGGVNGLATVGVKFSSNDTSMHLDAYQWKEDGISDKGLMLNFRKAF
ncbi:autotransporter outer membrane beta-barrel domain-containing protein [Lelliottia sp. WAP21]|uniref:BigA/YdbA N-terminal beta-barrel domain-containing protein n=2 Tax=Enterobacteriaceae TaxID=543 RepID=UPI001E47B1C7|nr:autotransporter outer membrane beta-barrel domain-containing protein [Lelliottia sp. WAP21]